MSSVSHGNNAVAQGASESSIHSSTSDTFISAKHQGVEGTLLSRDPLRELDLRIASDLKSVCYALSTKDTGERYRLEDFLSHKTKRDYPHGADGRITGREGTQYLTQIRYSLDGQVLDDGRIVRVFENGQITITEGLEAIKQRLAAVKTGGVCSFTMRTPNALDSTIESATAKMRELLSKTVLADGRGVELLPDGKIKVTSAPLTTYKLDTSATPEKISLLAPIFERALERGQAIRIQIKKDFPFDELTTDLKRLLVPWQQKLGPEKLIVMMDRELLPTTNFAPVFIVKQSKIFDEPIKRMREEDDLFAKILDRVEQAKQTNTKVAIWFSSGQISDTLRLRLRSLCEDPQILETLVFKQSLELEKPAAVELAPTKELAQVLPAPTLGDRLRSFGQRMFRAFSKAA